MGDPDVAGTATLARDLGFVEGPTLLRNGLVAVVSLDQQRLYVLNDGAPTTVATFDAAPNGATEGADGSVFVAAFSGAWPARSDCTGTGGVYACRPDGGIDAISLEPRAPNDLCFGPEGLLYVTDPVRGATAGRIWRIDPVSGDCEVVAEVDWYPNGIGFDGENALWVADTAGRRLLQMSPDSGEVLEGFDLLRGRPDGFAFDTDGHVVVAAPGTPEHPDSTVQVWDTRGDFVDVLLDGGSTYFTNVAIAEDGTTYVTEAQHGRVLRLDTHCGGGLLLHPFRRRGEDDM